MESKEDSCLEFVLSLATAVLIIPTLQGVIFRQLWSWFIVTAFAAPSLSLVQAVGVSMTVSFVSTDSSALKSDESPGLKDFLVVLATSVSILIVGFIWSRFL